MTSFLATSIAYLKGVGPQRAEVLLKEYGIQTFGDLLHYFPFRYVDRSQINQVRDIRMDTAFVQLKGFVSNFQTIGVGRGKRYTAIFTDSSGSIELVWFKGGDWLKKQIDGKQQYLLFGKPAFFNGKFNISHPELEVVADAAAAAPKGLQPVYPATEKARKKFLDSKALVKLTRALLDQMRDADVPEFLPSSVIQQQRLLPLAESLRQIHFPTSESRLQDAKHRIKFEEFFLIQLRLLKIKSLHAQQVHGILLEKIDNKFDIFYKTKLPFELTNAQKKVLREIRRDTLSGMQMNRLLQGDVGSGKTVVALLTMLMAIDNGYQAAQMVPTEILAQQHYESITQLVKGLGVEVALLTGSVKGKMRQYILNELAAGNIHILIGTHALIEDTVRFKQLGLVVIDEQHRFGVAQRASLWEKSAVPPHILVMTATPIPRTLAMTVYGDLDVSIMDELPPGRQPIKTVHRNDSDRLRVFGFVRDQIAEGRQVYFVYPMIEESEKSDLKNLMDGFESISRAFPLPQYKVSILHGKMAPADKDYEMQRFARGETQLLVATTVIEVGVNVPNASVMVIENAERFGLSQLHQLRGRVGRGAAQSYCILMTGGKLSSDSRRRIEVMCETNDGFVIAEEDLRLRGPGELDGTRQSGAMDLKMASIVEDAPLLEAARKAAFHLIEADPDLIQPENQNLRQFLQQRSKDQIWSRIS
ncbi:MAG: ATP-dependent DNA helicase RecG [Chitinophagales bacterium]